MTTTYSVAFDSPGETNSYAEWAIDWDWKSKGRWGLSTKDGLGSKWIDMGKLDKGSYPVLLAHFGLEDFEKDFPIEMIITMSPDMLTSARRRKEAELGLKEFDIKIPVGFQTS